MLLNRKKVVAKWRRYACVYNRVADVCVTFCEKGGPTAHVTDFYVNKI